MNNVITVSAPEHKAFDIRDHLDKLTPAKGKNRYICPVCEGNNLTINPETGKYKCWNECKCRDIREAIAPWEKTRNNRVIPAPRKPKVAAPKPVLIPEGELKLARLPQPVEIPQKRRIGDRIQIVYVYSDTQWVIRIEPPNGKKEIRPWHIDLEGDEKCSKGDSPWPLYRIAEIQAYGAGQWILLVEGEKCVEVARQWGLGSCTMQGSAWTEEELLKAAIAIKEAGARGICFYPDHDTTGYEKAEKMAIAAAKAQVPFILADPTLIWAECQNGQDIADWFEWGMQQGWDKEQFIKRLEQQFNAAAERSRLQQDDENDDWDDTCDGDTPDSFSPKETFTQFTLDALYGDKPWICIDDKLYYWTGTHYRHSKHAIEIKRIADWCNSYAVPSQDPLTGEVIFKYPYAKPTSVRTAMEWVKMRLLVDPDLVDPAGLNCTNGVLQIEWNVVEANPVPQWRLIDHSSELYYTYEPLVKYDPEADSEACDRLLEVLDTPQRDIFLKTIAASLDLATIRQHKGRLVRCLLLKGHGSNGKDTLREAVSMIYGHQGMTGCTLSDFAMYDEGRKFPLARLKHSRVNWAPENASTTRLDKIQSLKAFITGDTLSAEGKGKDESEFTPQAIALFNVNDTPKLQGTLEAIASRYGVLAFSKTFKIGANLSKGELEADPRFKYDPNFLRDEVLPAFLNRVLDALQRLMIEGIDYSCTQKALEDIQSENSHLFQFCQDVGLVYEPNAILTAGQIWERLEQWYQDNGTLTYEEDSKGKQKAVWSEQADPGDRNIKGANQVLGRFQQLFPKAKRVTVAHPNDGKKKLQALRGIGFSWGSDDPNGNCDNNGDEVPTPVFGLPTPIPPQDPPQKTTQNQGSHPTHPSSSYPIEKNNSSTDFGNVSPESQDENEKNSDTPQELGWVGCDAEESSIPGVGDCGGTGVGTEQTGVGELQQAELPIYQRSDRGFGIVQPKSAHRDSSKINPAIAQTEQVSPIRVSSRVRYTYPHSQRCGMIGTVKRISGLSATVWLDYHQSLTREQRELVSSLKDLELIVLKR